MTVRELIENNSLTAVNLPEPDREICGCYIGDLLSWVMGRANEDDCWITIMSNINTVAVATLTGVACVVLAEGVELDGDALGKAQENGINIISSPVSAYDTAKMLGGAF